MKFVPCVIVLISLSAMTAEPLSDREKGMIRECFERLNRKVSIDSSNETISDTINQSLISARIGYFMLADAKAERKITYSASDIRTIDAIKSLCDKCDLYWMFVRSGAGIKLRFCSKAEFCKFEASDPELAEINNLYKNRQAAP